VRRMTIVTSDIDTVVLVERALDQTAAIIAAIPGGQAGLATPWFGREPEMDTSRQRGRSPVLNGCS